MKSPSRLFFVIVLATTALLAVTPARASVSPTYEIWTALSVGPQGVLTAVKIEPRFGNHRVMRISVPYGYRLDFSVTTTASPDMDLGLALFPPGTAYVHTATPIATSMQPGVNNESISYWTPSSYLGPTFRQPFYVDIRDGSGLGGLAAYTYTLTPPPPPSVLPALPGHAFSPSYPITPSTVYSGRSFRMYGYLKPRHPAGAYSVKLEGYRYERQGDGTYKWIRRATWWPKNYSYSTYTKYVKYANIKLRGKWRVRPVHTHPGYLPKYGNYRYFTVR